MASPAVATARVPSGARRVVGDYVSLTRPRIIELLLITTVPAMMVAAGGWPGSALVLATLTGGALVSGSAHATNMVLDRDIDGSMRRTAHRPIPSGRIAPANALRFAVILLVVGTALLVAISGPLAAALTFGAWAWYVGVYTLWLKRRSPQNIVIGGAAGAAPPMIGWAAVTGTVELPALVLFTIVVLWTPTHFWALAIGTGEDYAQASIPMLPAVRGPVVAARHGVGYAVATVLASLALPLAGVGGAWLGVGAGLLGALFLARSLSLVRQPGPRAAWRLFHASNAYLAAVFLLVAVASVVP